MLNIECMDRQFYGKVKELGGCTFLGDQGEDILCSTSEASSHRHELRSFKKELTKIDVRGCLLMMSYFMGVGARPKEVIQKEVTKIDVRGFL